MTGPTVADSMAREIEAGLHALADPVRALGAKRYLKSELEFIGVSTAPFRRVVRGIVKAHAPDRRALVALIEALWPRPVFELKAAAVEAMVFRWHLLASGDLALLERLLRDSHTWALVDALSTGVVGRLVEREPALAGILDRWARDEDFWLRRAAMLGLLVPLRRGGGDWPRFAGYADAMLDEGEFFIRKAIGWVLREVAKKRPELVVRWLEPRLRRVSGVTMREAVRWLAAPERNALLAAWRAARRR